MLSTFISIVLVDFFTKKGKIYIKKGLDVIMWKKVIYIGIAVVIGIAVFLFGYNSNQMNHLVNLVDEAIENEKYEDVAKIWEGCFDTKSIVSNDKDNFDIVIYPATSQTDVTYGTDSTRYLKYEKAYYIYLFNMRFSYGSVNTGSGTNSNKAAIEFSNGDQSYSYYFIANDTTNSSSYIANPMTKEEALLNVSRDLTSTIDAWNFLKVTFTETMIKKIESSIGGEITGISIKDSTGETQFTANVQMNFSQEFFKDMEPLFTNYNIYLDAYLAANDDSAKIDAAANAFTEFYGDDKDTTKGWANTTFKEYETQKGYTLRYGNDILTPSKIMWQTVGIEALYLVVAALIYIMLFHFKAVRALFSRDNYKKYSSKNHQVIINGKVANSPKEKPQPKTEVEQIEAPKEEVAEEELEIVTAKDVTEQSKEAEPVKEEETPSEVKTDVIAPEESKEEEKPVEENKEVVNPPKKTTKKPAARKTQKKTTKEENKDETN